MSEAQIQAENAAWKAKIEKIGNSLEAACVQKEGVIFERGSQWNNKINYKNSYIMLEIKFKNIGCGWHHKDDLASPFVCVGDYGNRKIFKKIDKITGDLEYDKIVTYALEEIEKAIKKEKDTINKNREYVKGKNIREELSEEFGINEHGHISVNEFGHLEINVVVKDKKAAQMVLSALDILGVLTKKTK